MPSLTFDQRRSRTVAILEMVAQGKNNQEIAEALGLRPNTVKSWLRGYAYPMLGVPETCHSTTRRAVAVAKAYDKGLLKPPEDQ